MKKRITLFLMALMVTFSAFAHSYDFEYNGLRYKITSWEERTVEVTPGHHEVAGYLAEYIVIPSLIIYEDTSRFTVTGIGDNAFAEYENLKSVTIPSTVKTIGEYAFLSCSGLESISIPSSVTNIERGVFNLCLSLKSITVDPENTVYDSRNECNAIIKTSDDMLLYGSSGTVIPSDVKGIGECAFCGLNGITKVNISKNINYIGMGAFSMCNDLVSMTVDPQNTIYDSRDGCNAIIETSSNVLVAGCNKSTIPANVTSIGPGAFAGCFDLASADIPYGVTTIGYAAFELCTGLKSITIPSTVNSIQSEAFFGCSNIVSFYIPEGVKTIEEYTFGRCYSLTTIYFPSTLTSVGEEFIAACDSLKSIYCASANPPATINYSFIANDYIYPSCVLYVPSGSEDAYSKADGWKKFQNIKSFDPSGVRVISDKTDIIPVAYYTLSGKKIDVPQHGMNIIKYSNGQTKKVFLSE